MLARLVVSILLAAAGFAHAAGPVPDAARESRWAEEILPTLVVGDAVYLHTPERAKVLALLTPASGTEKAQVVLVHGLGVHPDFGMIGALRARLADRGYTTLSVQMPVLAADAPREDYPAIFPAAATRLQAAVAYLRSRGPAKVVVVSHSMGASMTAAWRGRSDAAPIDAWVPVGMLIPFPAAPREPVLDVIAEHDFPVVLEASPQRRTRLPADRCSGQVTIPEADHYFGRHDEVLAARIAAFIDRVVGGAC